VAVLLSLLALFFNLFEPLFRLGQRVLGSSRIGWLFVGPNLLVFGLFTFLPIIINLSYALTGGVNLMPQQRPFTGTENFAILLECRNYFDIQTCRKDVFWRAIFNTIQFSLIQVVLMVLLSLHMPNVTAPALKARGTQPDRSRKGLGYIWLSPLVLICNR
jgi:alpha-1,4-digalacturonate transport system permease protein